VVVVGWQGKLLKNGGENQTEFMGTDQ
jgi:hypothetical protein